MLYVDQTFFFFFRQVTKFGTVLYSLDVVYEFLASVCKKVRHPWTRQSEKDNNQMASKYNETSI